MLEFAGTTRCEIRAAGVSQLSTPAASYKAISNCSSLLQLPIVQFHCQILNEWQIAPKPSYNPVRDTNFHIRSEPNELLRKHTEWPGWSELGTLDASGGADPRGHGQDSATTCARSFF